MSGRIAALLGAVAIYHVSIVLALVFVIAGAILPWCAVLIANDRPARKKARRLGSVSAPRPRSLGGHSDDVVDD